MKIRFRNIGWPGHDILVARLGHAENGMLSPKADRPSNLEDFPFVSAKAMARKLMANRKYTEAATRPVVVFPIHLFCRI